MTDFSHLRANRSSRVAASGPFAHLLGGAHARNYEATVRAAEADRQARRTAEEILAVGAHARGEDPPKMHAASTSEAGSAASLGAEKK